MRTHKVEKGETLLGIADIYGITVAVILRANPSIKDANHINTGQLIKIPDVRPLRVGLKFNGSFLSIIDNSRGDGRTLKTFSARSGLPLGSKAVPVVSKAHNLDLDPAIDYTSPDQQGVKFAGPIPSGTYYLPLSERMKFDRSGRGWGRGGWLLKETFFGRVDNYFGGRSGFFLHHDGGHPGTSGCVGLLRGKDIIALQALLRRAYRDGQRELTLDVRYPE